MFNSFAKSTTFLMTLTFCVAAPQAVFAQDSDLSAPEVADNPVTSEISETTDTVETDDLSSHMEIGKSVVDPDGRMLGWITSVIKDETGAVTAVTILDVEGEVGMDKLSVADGRLVADGVPVESTEDDDWSETEDDKEDYSELTVEPTDEAVQEANAAESVEADTIE